MEWSAQRTGAASLDDEEPRHTPLSASAAKPKSILKPSPRVAIDFSLAHNANGPTAPAITGTMLESTIQQLAGGDRTTKLDAYKTLVQALRASDNLPDRTALREKMSLFMQFIQRDITAKSDNPSEESSVVTTALELLTIFLQSSALSSAISTEFSVFLIDHCIRTFENEASSKALVRWHMQAVYRQNFSPKVMTSDRVGRLVAALNTLESRVRGKSIIHSRLQIYHRLMLQCDRHMVTHSVWISDLFTDMFSELKEIRSAAITLGLEAGFTLAKEKQFNRKVADLLQRTTEEEKYVDFCIERLDKMYEKAPADVARVWSVMLLCLRGSLERWEYFHPFLKIIQRCFNGASFETKKEANLAWNRLVYIMHSDDRAFSRVIVTLTTPLASQLQRRSKKPSDQKRRHPVVLGSICNLLYYAFNPTNPRRSPDSIDTCWEKSAKVLLGNLAKDDETTDSATRILLSLLDQSSRMWKEDRVMELQPCSPEELPSLDAKWIRKNSSLVFEVMLPILTKRVDRLGDAESLEASMWRSFVASVSSASAKDIKVSVETATFIANTLGALSSLWLRGPAGEVDSAKFLHAIGSFVETIVTALGVLPFTERMLSNQNNVFAVAAGPSRPAKLGDAARNPLHHLFAILSTLPPNVEDDSGYSSFLKLVFVPFFKSRPTAKTRSELAREMIRSLPAGALYPSGPWCLAADSAREYLGQSVAESSPQPRPGVRHLGHEYREFVSVLECGLASTRTLTHDAWLALLTSLASRVRTQCGEAGVATSVVEPLSKILLEHVSGHVASNEYPYPNALALSAHLDILAIATHPRDRNALDAARKKIWDAPPRAGTFDPYDNFYKLINETLSHLYRMTSPSDSDVASVLQSFSAFLTRCNKALVISALTTTQGSLALWIRDDSSHISSRHGPAVAEAVSFL